MNIKMPLKWVQHCLLVAAAVQVSNKIKLIKFPKLHLVVLLSEVPGHVCVCVCVCVNDLPRVAARQCGGRESNSRPDRKSGALTTVLPSISHPIGHQSINQSIRGCV